MPMERGMVYSDKQIPVDLDTIVSFIVLSGQELDKS